MFTNHEYTVECQRCGNKQTNSDDGVDEKVHTLRVDTCRACCPESKSFPIQVPYDKEGERLYYK
jgi:hypothetical protein